MTQHGMLIINLRINDTTEDGCNVMDVRMDHPLVAQQTSSTEEEELS